MILFQLLRSVVEDVEKAIIFSCLVNRLFNGDKKINIKNIKVLITDGTDSFRNIIVIRLLEQKNKKVRILS